MHWIESVCVVCINPFRSTSKHNLDICTKHNLELSAKKIVLYEGKISKKDLWLGDFKIICIGRNYVRKVGCMRCTRGVYVVERKAHTT
jgi:hypothetical protein